MRVTRKSAIASTAVALLALVLGCSSAGSDSEADDATTTAVSTATSESNEADAEAEPANITTTSDPSLPSDLIERGDPRNDTLLTFYGDDIARCVHARTGDDRLFAGLRAEEEEHYRELIVACQVSLNVRRPSGEPVSLGNPTDSTTKVVAPCLVDEHGWTQSASVEDGVMGAVRPHGLSDAATRADLEACGFYTPGLSAPFCVLFICF